MNRTKNIQLIALTALLAVNVGAPLQANDSLPQRMVSGLFNLPEPVKVCGAVTAGAIAYGSAQRYMTTSVLGPKTFKEYTQGLMFDRKIEESLHDEGGRLNSYSYNMSSYKQAVLVPSAAIGSIAAIAACLGASPLDVSEGMKLVAVGMGVIGASYFAGAVRGYNEFYKYDDNERKRYVRDEQNHRRYLAAKKAYNYASTITPWVIGGVALCIIYDRYNCS